MAQIWTPKIISHLALLKLFFKDFEHYIRKCATTVHSKIYFLIVLFIHLIKTTHFFQINSSHGLRPHSEDPISLYTFWRYIKCQYSIFCTSGSSSCSSYSNCSSSSALRPLRMASSSMSRGSLLDMLPAWWYSQFTQLAQRQWALRQKDKKYERQASQIKLSLTNKTHKTALLENKRNPCNGLSWIITFGSQIRHNKATMAACFIQSLKAFCRSSEWIAKPAFHSK